MNKEMIIVLDFGGQYNQLIARRVRECNVYAEVHPYTLSLDKIKEMNPKGIIFTGGPNSVYGEESPRYQKEIFDLGIPILGICYGSQLMAYMLGGTVETAPVSEYGRTEVDVDNSSAIFQGVKPQTICWMSHTDYISKAPEGFKVVAKTPVCPVAAMECPERKLYATQFHPEVMHTEEGQKMLSNFVYNVCGCSGDWKMDSFVETTIREIREKVGDGKVSSWSEMKEYYNPQDVIEAARLMVSVADKYQGNNNFEFDLVDVLRQALAEKGRLMQKVVTAAFRAGDKQVFELASQHFLHLILLQDQLLGTRKEFKVGTWIEAARSAGQTQEEKALYEWNARVQITTWGNRVAADQGGLRDYAHKEWNGILKDFYFMRWKAYFDYLACVLDGKQPEELDFYTLEEAWTKETGFYSSIPEGNTVVVAKNIFEEVF